VGGGGGDERIDMKLQKSEKCWNFIYRESAFRECP
jgi:hypothetical protein